MADPLLQRCDGGGLIGEKERGMAIPEGLDEKMVMGRDGTVNEVIGLYIFSLCPLPAPEIRAVKTW